MGSNVIRNGKAIVIPPSVYLTSLARVRISSVNKYAPRCVGETRKLLGKPTPNANDKVYSARSSCYVAVDNFNRRSKINKRARLCAFQNFPKNEKNILSESSMGTRKIPVEIRLFVERFLFARERGTRV